jgi:hypothetical protein
VDGALWKLLLFATVQGKGSVATVDVSEAFQQSSEKFVPKDKLFLRMPSCWKGSLLPSILAENGVSADKVSEHLFEVVKSLWSGFGLGELEAYSGRSAEASWFQALTV